MMNINIIATKSAGVHVDKIKDKVFIEVWNDEMEGYAQGTMTSENAMRLQEKLRLIIKEIESDMEEAFR